MNKQPHFRIPLFCALLAAGAAAHAGVVVTTSGNTAMANISLSSGGHTYTADVTIAFNGAQNLNPTELNFSAQVIDPTDPGLLARLPACTNPALGCVTIDANFPLLITVEPLNLASGNLSFLNSYTFEVHTANLTYVPYSQYRLDKAPLTGAFDDVSTAIESGSVRARGSGGTFSQFLVVSDTRPSLVVEGLKEGALQNAIAGAALSGNLQNDLLGWLSNVHTEVGAGNYTAAISNLDQMIAEIQAHAGIDIANVWSSNHLLANDAGGMLSAAQTLRYTLARLQNGH
jgi:hypothetical protein